MEQDDEEFEQLLCEIPHATSTNTVMDVPRATSAPPHLEELQRVHGSEVEEGPIGMREDEAPVKPFIDIRCDEHYESFYRSYAGVKKLPPPMDNRTLYSDLPVLSPKASVGNLSPFLAGLTLDDTQRKQQRLDVQRKQHVLQQHQLTSQQQAQQQQQQQQREPTPSFQGPGGAHAYGAPTQKDISSDPHMTTAGYGSLSFDEGSNILLQSFIDDTGDTRTVSNGSSGGLAGRPPLSNGHGLAAESNGLYSPMDAFGTGSAASSYELYASRSSPSRDLFQGKSLVSMNGLGNGSYDGMTNYSDNPTQAFKKALRQQNSLGSYGSGGVSQYQQQQQLEVVAATLQAAARNQSAIASGNVLQSGRLQKQISLDYNVADYFEAQQLVEAQVQAHATAMAAQYAHLEEQQQRLYMQQQVIERQKQIQLLASLHAQVNGIPGGVNYPSGSSTSMRGSRNSSELQQQLGFAATNAQHNQALQRKLKLQQAVNPDAVWGPNAEVSEFGLSDNSRRPPSVGSVCRYFTQGYCSRGDACPFLHSPLYGSKAVSHTASLPVKEAAHSTTTCDGRLPPYLDKILRRSSRAIHPEKANSFAPASGIQRVGDVVSNGHANGHGHGYPNGHFSPGSGHVSPTDPITLAHPQSRIQDHMEFDVGRLMVPHNLQQQQPPKYTTIEEVEGHIYLIAKDQHGCRFLQKKFDEGGPEDVEKIFREIINHITELMKDPFGNYLVQKLLEVCDENQRMEILRSVTVGGELVRISLNMHGTRAVQKLIETLKSQEQVAMVIAALADGVVELTKDLNGNHVVQRCLQKLSHEDSQFIFDAAALHCVEIATHRHGCCVMQRCVDFAVDHQRQRLVVEVAANALSLSQDAYGNYVVQYILDLKSAWSSTEVMARLEGNYAFLSMQKFSSNVVEKCLKLGVEEPRARLVRELMTSPHLGQLLQDQYANYVIQSALSVCKGALHTGLVDAIRPHLPALRNSPYGKRILSRTNPKK
ncbi:unnamed protein product [Sphagnum balticum]